MPSCHDSSSLEPSASGLCLADLVATSPVWSSVFTESAALLTEELSCTSTGNGATWGGQPFQLFSSLAMLEIQGKEL